LPPFSFRWLFNGTNLLGAAGPAVSFPSVQMSHAGNYQVIITHSLGAATSEVATLPVKYFTVSGYAWDDQNANAEWERMLVKGLEPDIVFVVDASRSTTKRLFGSEVGDVNGDGRTNTILDAELAALIGLNSALVQQGFATNSRGAVVAFSTAATNADMNPLLPGVQWTAAAGADETGYYGFTNLTYGSYSVRQVTPAGWWQTYPTRGGAHGLQLTTTFNLIGLNFGSVRQALLTVEWPGGGLEPEFVIQRPGGSLKPGGFPRE
jgi:hypothetical protein